MGDFRKTGYSGTMIFDPFAKRRTDCPPEVEEANYRKIFTQYCSECMEAFDLHEGKLVNRRIGICGICGSGGKDVFLVGNMNADDGRIFYAQQQVNARNTLDKFCGKGDL